jgi:hypothetical protein
MADVMLWRTKEFKRAVWGTMVAGLLVMPFGVIAKLGYLMFFGASLAAASGVMLVVIRAANMHGRE